MVKAKVKLGNKTISAKKTPQCSSCGQSGHATNKSKKCPDHPDNQKSDFNGKAVAKELVKAEKVAEAVEEAGVAPELNDAVAKLQAMEAELAKHQAEVAKQMEAQRAVIEEQEQLAKAKLEKQWEHDNQQAMQKWEADMLAYLKDTGVADTPDSRKLYLSFVAFKEVPKPWIKKRPRKKGGGGGGGRTKQKPTDQCQARLFYRHKGQWVRPDYCGCEKVAGTDFCSKHQGDLVEGRMNDGICPKISEEHLATLVGNEKYGEENQKQFGMLK
jgi:hypothetical protein